MIKKQTVPHVADKKPPQHQTNAEWLADYDSAEWKDGEPLVKPKDSHSTFLNTAEFMKVTTLAIVKNFEEFNDEVV